MLYSSILFMSFYFSVLCFYYGGVGLIVCFTLSQMTCFSVLCKVGLNDLLFSDRNCDFRQRDHVIAKAVVFAALLTDPGSVVSTILHIQYMPPPYHPAKLTNQKWHATPGQVTLTNQY